MTITNEQIDKLKAVYYSNGKDLENLADYIKENGITDDGLTNAGDSFEQGYNNALEFVFRTLGIKF